MLLHVEKQIAAFAGGIEVRAIGQPLQIKTFVLGCQILPKSSNIIGCACIASCGNEFTRLDYVATCDFAIEAQTHESSRPQKRQQHSPSHERVGQMVQHSTRFDDVESAHEVAELENIGLCILD